MKILLEEHQYRADLVDRVLSGITNLRDVNGLVSIDYVGYYYNPTLNDCVFILPKVLLDVNDKVFGKYNPDDIIDLEQNEKLEEDRRLTDKERTFIYELSVWIYRAIVVFNEKNPDNNIVKKWNVTKMGHGRLRMCNTYLDILLALQKFNHENQDFFFFILKNLHSGFNKINWTRTISRSQAIIQDDSPIYLNPVNKKRKINFDEELLVIFFSILNYMNKEYGFPVEINVNFPLITGKKFDSYRDGMGVVRLRQIKYKYFSDRALYLWELCFAFFEQSKKIRVVTGEKEILIVKDFNLVFEAIIDELIGTPHQLIPKGLADQPDGKRVDHMFFDQGLIEHDDSRPVYYIGDSKYYKRRTPVGENSVYKQFTYARNVIQWNMDLFLDEKQNDELKEDRKKYRDNNTVKKLRDDVTEGYNIIPNFFISARQDDLTTSSKIVLTDKDNKSFTSKHFNNRLYDRDTLIVSHYDVNFLYVVSLYGRKNEGEKTRWRTEVREEFRKQVQKILQTSFDFFVMTPRQGVNAQAYFKVHFKEILGKTFAPFDDEGIYSLALDKDSKYKESNEALMNELKKYFIVRPCGLGQDPAPILYIARQEEGNSVPIPDKNGVLMVMMESYNAKNKGFLPSGKLAVGIKLTKDSMELLERHSTIGYVLFHQRKDDGQHLFAIKDSCHIVLSSEVGKDRYKNINTAEMYLAIDLDTPELDASLLDSTKKNFEKESRYDAQYAVFDELLSNK